jgi:pheromone a factor receptor
MSAILPVAAFVAAVLLLVPLPSHIQARNIPTVSIMLWLFLINVAHGVNTIVWANNARIQLVTWCDIGENASLCLFIYFAN